MKYSIFCLFLLTLFACSQPSSEEGKPLKSSKLKWADNIQTIMPLETDTGWHDQPDLLNQALKPEKEKLFRSVIDAVFAGKLTAYENYPGTALTPEEAKVKIIQWDSTAMCEDPNNPGVMVSCPIKSEITSEFLTRIKFNETIELDTVNYSLSKKVSFITLYTYKFTETGRVVGMRKIFDVKMNE